MSFSSPVFQERTDMPSFHSGKRAWNGFFLRKSRTHTSERRLKISTLTKHLPRVTVRTHGDLQVTLTGRGNTAVHEESGMIYSQQTHRVHDTSFRPRCHQWTFGYQVQESPEDPPPPALCRKPDSMRYVQHHQVQTDSWPLWGIFIEPTHWPQGMNTSFVLMWGKK